MLYRIFNTQREVAEANGRYLYKLYKSGELMKDIDKRSNPSKTTAWDFGKKLKDGRIACKVPTKNLNDFGGVQENITSDKFGGK